MDDIFLGEEYDVRLRCVELACSLQERQCGGVKFSPEQNAKEILTIADKLAKYIKSGTLDA